MARVCYVHQDLELRPVTMKYLLKADRALFTSAGAAWKQTEVFQYWQNGSSKEDPEQEGTRWNKEKSKCMLSFWEYDLCKLE